MEGKIHTFITLIGTLSVTECDDAITGLYFPSNNLPCMESSTSDLLDEAEGEIGEYLSGRRKKFDLPLSYTGTEFRIDVLDAMRGIPYGTTVTYSDLAESSGHLGASRAVGTACRGNPIPIIIPCHRVLPSSGGLGNYAPGKHFKKILLEIESRQ